VLRDPTYRQYLSGARKNHQPVSQQGKRPTIDGSFHESLCGRFAETRIQQRRIRTLATVAILRNLPWFGDPITNGEIDHLQEAMRRPSTDSAVTFDLCLCEPHLNGQISLEDALRHATSENNLRLRIQLEGAAPKDRQENGSTLHTVEF